MKAVVVEEAGGPEVLQIRQMPRPEPRPGWVLIRVRAFGLNRSEMFTRQGHSGDAVPFPRVLGIECAGEVVAAPDTELQPGQTVTAVMGGMGRAYDGSYAEYTLVPASQVIPLATHLPWTTLAAIPETYLTAWGSLAAMDTLSGQVLLVRGGTSSLGMAAAVLAKDQGLTVIATTRNEAKAAALRDMGVDWVVIDTDIIQPAIRALVPEGVHAVLELVGTKTLLDSLQCVRPKGIVCYSGILGNEWVLPRFEPFLDIPSTVKLTTFSSETLTAEHAREALQHVVDGVASGRYPVTIDRTFSLEDIVAAHRYMEENQATGKLVVVVAP